MNDRKDDLDTNRRFEFASQAYDPDTFAVVKLEGHEGISRLYRFELVLVSHNPAIDLDKMLQASATLRILPVAQGAPALPYHGVLAEFDQLRQAGGYTFYRAMLVPRLWRLSMNEASDVYLDERSIPQIVEGILREHQFTSEDYELKLKGSYRDRSYVCQYKESDLDFIARWLEKEGIYFYFDHDGHREKLILLDDRILQPAGAKAVVYRPTEEPGTNEADDAVRTFMCQQRPLPAEVVLEDYNPRKAGLALSASAPVAPHGFGKVVLYGENFRSPEEGARYAKIRAQEIACAGRVFSGDATATGLRSGRFMALSNHYRSDFNGEYLITEVTHHGSQAGALLAHIDTPYKDYQDDGRIVYQCAFRATPAATQFRPARTTPKPTVAGTLSAMVDAEGSGQFAELDEYGQYKVQLTFDHTDKAAGHGSARIRMASPYAGADHGMHFPLHKDTEVLLSFNGGDPDQPVILSAVPNSDTRNIVTRDTANLSRIATKGGNQMFMSDSPGAETTWLHSPHNNSHVIIGAMAASADGTDTNADTPNNGLSFFTLGTNSQVQVGGMNRVTFGPTHTLTGGTESSISVTAASRVALAGTTAISLASDLNWNVNSAPSVGIYDGGTISLAKQSIARVSSKMTMSAGVRQDQAAVKDTIDALKFRTRAAVGAITGVNIAMGGAMAGTLGGVSDGKGGVFALKDSPAAIGTMTADMASNVLTTAAGLISASKIAKELSKHYEDLVPISDITLDENGIELKTDLSQGSNGVSTISINSSIALSSDNSTSSKKATCEIGAATGVKLSYGNDHHMSLSQDSGRPETVIQTGAKTFIKANQAQVSMEAGTDSKLTVKPDEITSTVGAGRSSVTTKSAKLEVDPDSGISVQPKGIALRFPGGSASYDTGMIQLDGELIKLG